MSGNYDLAYYLSQPYVQNALLVAVLVALCAALLGVSLVLRRYSLIGDGLSHVSFGAMAIAAVFGLTELYIMLPLTVLAAIVLLQSGSRAKVKGDAAVAIISVSSLAIAYLLYSKFSTGNVATDVCKTLFGSSSIMTLKTADIWLSVGLTAAVMVFFLVFYHKIFAVTFDEPFAQATGTGAKVYNLLLAAVTGIVIALAMKLVGALLITALLVFPALSAMRLFKSFKQVMLASAILSVLCAAGGILISLLIPGLPVGSTIVAAELLMFGLCTLAALFISLLRGGKKT